MAIFTKPQTSTTSVGGYDFRVNSLFDINLPPDYIQKIYSAYGPNSFGFFDYLKMIGREVNVSGDKLDMLETGAIRRSIKIGSGGIAVAAAGVNITFTLASDQYNSLNAGPLRKGDSIFIPPNYCEVNNVPATMDLEYRVSNISASGPSGVYTAVPLQGTFEISLAVPANTILRKGGNKHGRGTDQPEPMNSGVYKRSFTNVILKETIRIEGGQQAQKRYTDMFELENVLLRNGQQGLYGWALAEAEFRLKDQMNDTIFLSYENSNANLTENNKRGEARPVLSLKGIRNWIDERGQLQTYSGNYAFSDFDQIKRIQISQGFGNGVSDFLVGSELNLDIENGTLDHIKTYSQGTDFTRGLDSYGIKFKVIEKNGVTVVLKEIPMFSEVMTYGSNANYNYTKQGMIIPRSNESVYANNNSVVLPNVFIGYLNNNGEDRKYIIQPVSGVNGMGMQATNTYDEMEWALMTEFTLGVAKPNQMIWVKPQ